jgi:succinate-acetate transporter protein
VATAALAWYASSAGVLNETLKKSVLPTWPLGR